MFNPIWVREFPHRRSFFKKPDDTFFVEKWVLVRLMFIELQKVLVVQNLINSFMCISEIQKLVFSF